MFKINIKDLEITTIIGILEEERKRPQKIVVNAKIEYTGKDYLDYSKVVNAIEELLVKKKYKLIEDALIDIVSELKTLYRNIHKIYIEIDKLNIIDNCTVGVGLTKKYYPD